MINLDKIVNNNNEEHNEKWPYIPNHPYRILMIGGSRSGKTSTLLHLINEQKDIDKIYLYSKVNQSMNIWLKIVKMQQ